MTFGLKDNRNLNLYLWFASCIWLNHASVYPKKLKKKEIEKKNIAFFGPQYVGSWIHLVPCFAFSSHVRVKFIRFDSWEIVRLERILEIVIVSISFQILLWFSAFVRMNFFPVLISYVSLSSRATPNPAIFPNSWALDNHGEKEIGTEEETL